MACRSTRRFSRTRRKILISTQLRQVRARDGRRRRRRHRRQVHRPLRRTRGARCAPRGPLDMVLIARGSRPRRRDGRLRNPSRAARPCRRRCFCARTPWSYPTKLTVFIHSYHGVEDAELGGFDGDSHWGWRRVRLSVTSARRADAAADAGSDAGGRVLNTGVLTRLNNIVGAPARRKESGRASSLPRGIPSDGAGRLEQLVEPALLVELHHAP